MSPTLHFTIRALHVLLGAYWVGAVLFVVAYLEPAVRATGPDGGRVMGHIVGRRYPTVMVHVGATTIITGIYLLWVLSGRFSPGFMGSLGGILLSTGMLLSIVALLLGVVVARPAALRLTALGGEIAASGAAPSQEQAAEMGRLQARMRTIMRLIAVLLLATLVTMALGPHL